MNIERSHDDWLLSLEMRTCPHCERTFFMSRPVCIECTAKLERLPEPSRLAVQGVAMTDP